jgi:hypothetical protein
VAMAKRASALMAYFAFIVIIPPQSNQTFRHPPNPPGRAR